MKNLLIITPNFPPAICGVGDHTANLVREFDKMGYRVVVFTETKEAVSDKVIVSKTPFGDGIAAQLQQLIQAHHITHILWQYVPYSYHKKGLPFWLPRVMKNIRQTSVSQLIYFHEVSLRYLTDGVRQTVLAFFQRRIARRANELATASFTNTALYSSYFYQSKPTVVPVGSNLPQIVGDFPVVKGRIFCFANRTDLKIIQALSMVKATFDISLVIGGSINSSQRQQIENWLQQCGLRERTRITGALPGEALTKEITTAELVLLPQPVNKHGQGGVSTKNGTVMAAMSLGKAIISCSGDMTDSDLFIHGRNIHLAARGEYALALQYCLENPAYIQQLGSNARQSFEQQCTWERIASSLIDKSLQGLAA